MATLHRTPPPGLLFHTDRGVQYAAGNFRDGLEGGRFRLPSMSRRGNCYDNAAMESFWSTLKLELVYRGSFHQPPTGQIRDLRLHRSLLQPPAPSHLPRRPFTLSSSNSKTTNVESRFLCPLFRSRPTRLQPTRQATEGGSGARAGVKSRPRRPKSTRATQPRTN